tara:strand:+ start:331 stop:825 length:495 start_codon:yes stop_codon:yes gene_type:complete
MELIASYTATGTVASIDFTSIAADWTDLCIKISTRSAATGGPDWIDITLNGDSAITYYSNKWILGSGSTVTSSGNNREVSLWEPSSYTANTFSNAEIYIPNYLSSNQKSYSSDSVIENNATASYMSLIAGKWATTSAITSIGIVPRSTTFTQYSSAYLYGVKNA